MGRQPPETSRGEISDFLEVPLSYEFPIQDANISGYERMTMLSTFNDKDKNPEQYDPEHVDFYDAQGNAALTADISGFVNACISANALNPLGTPDFPGEIKLEDGSLLLVSHCSITVEPDQSISFLDLNAVLLTHQHPE